MRNILLPENVAYAALVVLEGTVEDVRELGPEARHEAARIIREALTGETDE